jgi:hypothetical protein
MSYMCHIIQWTLGQPGRTERRCLLSVINCKNLYPNHVPSIGHS